MWWKKVAAGFAFLLAIGTILFAWQVKKEPSALAAKTVVVGKLADLKKQLATNETATIQLKDNITISEKLTVNGNKTIDGCGRMLRRKTKVGEVFQGGLIKVAGSLVLRDVTVSGCGRNPNVVDGAKERLIQVVGNCANLVLETGTTLVQNYNANEKLDAGGALLISKGAGATMKAGSCISDNRSQTGGGAIRIENGGSFVMEGGIIEQNEVNGASEDKGLLGLGGAIHNAGDVEIKGGEIRNNRASSTVEGKNQDAGVGGAIYNLGRITIYDCAIYNNKASFGAGGIYSTQGATLNIKGGIIHHNSCNYGPGGGLFINNGGVASLEGGAIYDNCATCGGGVYISKANSRVSMYAGNIYGNTSTQTYGSSGPGVRNNGATFIMEGGVINANQGGTIIENRCIGQPDTYLGSALCNCGDGTNSTIRGGMIYCNHANSKPIYNTETALLQYESKKLIGIEGSAESGIVNRGKMLVSGNSHCGVKGNFENVIHNSGNLQINYGIISGANVGVKNYSILEVNGGAVEGNKYGVDHKNGRFILSGKGIVSHVFLAKNQIIEQAESLGLQNVMQITPEDYYDGRLVGTVCSGNDNGSTLYGQSKLTDKKNFYLYWKDKDVRIGQKNYFIVFDGNGGIGQMNSIRAYMDEQIQLPTCEYQKDNHEFIGWSRSPKGKVELRQNEKVVNLGKNEEKVTLYAIWAKKPELTLKSESLEFYEGENVQTSILLSFVRAKDEKDGDISERIKLVNITYPNGSQSELPIHLDTSSENIGACHAIFEVTNSSGLAGTVSMPITIVKNNEPQIESEERYFYVGNKSEQLITKIRNGLTIHDVEDKSEDILHYLEIDASKIIAEKPGRYPVKVWIRDQRGHRFYMQKDEVREYGSGKSKCISLFVNVEAGNVNKPDVSEGHVRFISKESINSISSQSKWKDLTFLSQLKKSLSQVISDKSCKQVWEFSSAEIKAAKKYMASQSNPFTLQCNRGFLYEFSRNIKRSIVGGGDKS